MLFFVISLSNSFLVWFFMEILFLFFMMISVSLDTKNFGLIIYYFFQSFMSLFLFLMMVMWETHYFMVILIAKLGLFPFFYWVVVVSMKIDIVSNMFVLVFQKFPVLWLMWLINHDYLIFFILFSYLSIFFAVISLVLTSDIWLLLVYSSIANTSMLVLGVFGGYMWESIFVYLTMVLSILILLKYSTNYNDILFVIYLFLMVPPFFLFLMKYYLVLSLMFNMKLIFLIFMLDVFMLLYYFSVIFSKFLLFESSTLLYFMNFLIIFFILLMSNCVTLIIFD